MAFIATKPEGGNFEPAPVGMHIARCFKLIDLGTQQKSYQGKPTGAGRKVSIAWELLGEDRMQDGRPFSLTKSYFLSLHEKAAMRKDLESWRGKPFTPEEEGAFDVSKLLGAYCMLNVIRESGENGKEYTKISAITPMMKGLQKPQPVNEIAVFDLENPDMAMFEAFHDKLKEIIQSSPEWKARQGGMRQATTTGTPGTNGIDEDDIPW
jgi:hypothetical protein